MNVKNGTQLNTTIIVHRTLLSSGNLTLILCYENKLLRTCFNSRQRRLLRRLYQQIFVQTPVVRGIKHRVYFMFLDRVKSLWAWVRILISGFDKGSFFLFIVFLDMYLLYIFNYYNFI